MAPAGKGSSERQAVKILSIRPFLFCISISKIYPNPYHEMHFRAQISPKSVFGPAGGAYDGWKGGQWTYPSPSPLPLDAFGVWIFACQWVPSVVKCVGRTSPAIVTKVEQHHQNTKSLHPGLGAQWLRNERCSCSCCWGCSCQIFNVPKLFHFATDHNINFGYVFTIFAPGRIFDFLA